jgi:ribose-phosphate pyrophosphokinase
MTKTPKHYLLYCPQMKRVAEKVTKEHPEITLSNVNFKEFPDTFPDLTIEEPKALEGNHVTFLASFDKKRHIFDQYSTICALSDLDTASFQIILPYYPTGTMERMTSEKQVATADSLARMFAGIRASGPGPVPMVIYDIHALQNRHYFPPTIRPKFKTGTKLLTAHLKTLPNFASISLAYPDDGSYKRFGKMEESGFNTFPYVICAKTRVGNERFITIIEGADEIAGRDMVIVDDLSHSGKTLMACAEKLLAAGAKSVSVYVTHGVMEKNAYLEIAKFGFDKIWMTDSHPMWETVENMKPFEILSIAKSIGNAVLKIS